MRAKDCDGGYAHHPNSFKLSLDDSFLFGTCLQLVDPMVRFCLALTFNLKP